MLKRTFPTLLNQGLNLAEIIPYAFYKHPAEFILNQVFKELLIDKELDFIENKVICIKVKDKDLQLLLTTQSNKIKLLKDTAYHAKITASTEGFILIAARKIDPDTLFFQRRLTLEGDTDLGHAFKNTLDALDLEELPLPVKKTVEKLAYLVDFNLA